MLSCSLILELSLPPLSSVSFHFVHFKALLLGTDALRIAMLSWCIDPFIIILCFLFAPGKLFLLLGSCFALKYSLSDINIVTIEIFG